MWKGEIRRAFFTLTSSITTYTNARNARLGRYAGHIITPNDLTWRSLALSIPAILRFQLYGIPFVGMDICGKALRLFALIGPPCF